MSGAPRYIRRQPPPHDLQRLRDEIRFMEARLVEVGHDGDCAYERALVRFYHEQLAVRRARLGTV